MIPSTRPFDAFRLIVTAAARRAALRIPTRLKMKTVLLDWGRSAKQRETPQPVMFDDSNCDVFPSLGAPESRRHPSARPTNLQPKANMKLLLSIAIISLFSFSALKAQTVALVATAPVGGNGSSETLAIKSNQVAIVSHVYVPEEADSVGEPVRIPLLEVTIGTNTFLYKGYASLNLPGPASLNSASPTPIRGIRPRSAPTPRYASRITRRSSHRAQP